MNAKPVLLLLSLGFFACFISFPTLADAPAEDNVTTLNKADLEAKIYALTERIELLKDAKKQAVDREEKREIRHEIRDIKKEAKALKQQASGGIYIGSGVLIVALLLILLL